MRLFSCGANLWRSSAGIQPKKVQPLGIYFWHLRLGLFKSPFWLVKLNICGCSLLLGQMYFQQKTCVLHFGRFDTKFLNLSHHFLSVDGWPGDATFFLWGKPLKIIRRYSAKKGPAPWNLFLTPARQQRWSPGLEGTWPPCWRCGPAVSQGLPACACMFCTGHSHECSGFVGPKNKQRSCVCKCWFTWLSDTQEMFRGFAKMSRCHSLSPSRVSAARRQVSPRTCEPHH